MKFAKLLTLMFIAIYFSACAPSEYKGALTLADEAVPLHIIDKDGKNIHFYQGPMEVSVKLDNNNAKDVKITLTQEAGKEKTKAVIKYKASDNYIPGIRSNETPDGVELNGDVIGQNYDIDGITTNDTPHWSKTTEDVQACNVGFCISNSWACKQEQASKTISEITSELGTEYSYSPFGEKSPQQACIKRPTMGIKTVAKKHIQHYTVNFSSINEEKVVATFKSKTEVSSSDIKNTLNCSCQTKYKSASTGKVELDANSNANSWSLIQPTTHNGLY